MPNGTSSRGGETACRRLFLQRDPYRGRQGVASQQQELAAL